MSSGGECELMFKVEGMTCSSCSGTIERALAATEGVIEARVNLLEHRACVLFDSARIAAADIIDSVESVGFDCFILEEKQRVTAHSPLPTKSQLVLALEGMTCSSCSGSIERLLQSEHGVIQAQVTLSTNSARVEFMNSETSSETLMEAVESIGFGAEIISETLMPNEEEKTKAASPAIASKKLEITVSIPKTQENPTWARNDVTAFLESLPGVQQTYRPPLAPSSPSSKNYEEVLGVIIDEETLSIRSLVELTERELPPGSQVTPSVTAGGFRRGESLLQQQRMETSVARSRFLYSLFLTLPLALVGMLFKKDPQILREAIPGISYRSLILWGLSSPVLFVLGRHFHTKAFKTVAACGRAAIGMDFMISMGTLSAYAFSFVGLMRGWAEGAGCSRDEDTDFFQTSAMLIAVMLFGKFLESYGRGFTSSAIHALTHRRATSARLVMGYEELKSLSMVGGGSRDAPKSMQKVGHTRSGGGSGAVGRQDKEVAVPFLGRGDVVRVVTGDTVPADGVLLGTEQSLITCLEGVGEPPNFQMIQEILSSGEYKKMEKGQYVAVDESMLSGESLPVYKNPGNVIHGGSVVVEGSLCMLVKETGDDSTLGRIVSTVQEAQASKPPIQEIADRIARLFVPIVSSIALAAFLGWLIAGLLGNVPEALLERGGEESECPANERDSSFSDILLLAFSRGLAVWVSACPCAFGLATPTAVLVATGVAASNGLLFRKGSALQHLSEVDTVALDKTGTLTSGRMSVTDCHTLVDSPSPSLDLEWPELYLMILKSELRSAHPLARGIASWCEEKAKTVAGERVEVLKLSYIAGKGLEAELSINKGSERKSCRLLVGTADLMTSRGLVLGTKDFNLANSMREGGKVAVFAALEETISLVFGVADTIRPEAVQVVRRLQQSGLEVIMITGDEEVTARAIGAAVGIPQQNIFSRASPDDKEKIVRDKQQRHRRRVAFVGDGTNDTPALARANVGIVMSSGTDIAVEVGDVVLCKSDLTSLLIALDISRVAMRRIMINYFWALGYNVLLIPVAAGALSPYFHFSLDPTYAGAAMALSSVSVVLSSLSLFLYRPSYQSFQSDFSIQERFTEEGLCKCPISTSTEHADVEDSVISRLRQFFFSSTFSRSPLVYNELNKSSRDDIEMADAGTNSDTGVMGGCGCGGLNCRCGPRCNCKPGGCGSEAE